jgi:pyruvate dehydrogenase E2 component (dihydrolipoyllysine-residue acetyltransferase)
MSVQEIFIPDIGGADNVDVIEVLVAVGDTVAVDDPLLTLESDKASMEIPAPAAGVIKELKIKVGDTVSEGSLILTLDAEEASATGTTTTTTTEPAASPAPAAAPVAALEAPAAPDSFDSVHASPGTRRMARLESVNLAEVAPSGPKGRVTKDDVQQFLSAGGKTTGAAEAGTGMGTGMGVPPIPAVDFTQFGPVEEQALSRIKRVSGPHLHRAWLNVPMVTHHDEADITELEAFRKSLKAEAEKDGVRITPLAFIMKAVTAALKAFPEVNSSLSPDGKTLLLKGYYNVGIAVDTPNGLVVPVIRDVDKKSIYELSQDLAEVSLRAREGKLSPTDMQGGCFSISSLGGIGGTAFTPIVNAPEVAILGVTRSFMKPVWSGDQFHPRLTLPLDLSYDHRVIDGAMAAHFVAHLCRNLNDTRRLLLK